MPEHNVITDPNIHEPKGASTATSGQVYVANGAGSGAWAAKLPSQTGNAGKFLTTNGTTESWSSASVFAGGSVTSGGALTGGVNASVVRNSTGTYTVTFTSAASSVNYQPIVTLNTTSARSCSVYNKATGSFIVRTVSIGSSPALVDVAFEFAVFGG